MVGATAAVVEVDDELCDMAPVVGATDVDTVLGLSQPNKKLGTDKIAVDAPAVRRKSLRVKRSLMQPPHSHASVQGLTCRSGFHTRETSAGVAGSMVESGAAT